MHWNPLKFACPRLRDLVSAVLFCACLLPQLSAAADEGQILDPRLRLSAFGTLGVVYDGSSKHLQRDFGQPDSFHGKTSLLTDSLLGAQFDLRIGNGLDATVQMVAKDRTEQSLDSSLEWAFLRWRPLQDLTLRAGRLGLDLYLLSDCRNVGFAYLWQRPVVEFYGPLLIQNFDGADASYVFKIGEGRLQTRLFGGVTKNSLPFMQPDRVNVLEFNPILGASIGYENDQFRFSAGYARARFAGNLSDVSQVLDGFSSVPQQVWPGSVAISRAIANRHKSINFYSLGASYEGEDWVLQAEAGYLHSDWATVRDIASGYLSLGRHCEAFTPYLVLAAAQTRGAAQTFSAPPITGDPTTDAQLSALYLATQLFTPGVAVDQRTVSAGVRWDVQRNLALKLQWDTSRVAAQGGSLWWGPASGPQSSATTVNLLSTSLNFAY